MVLARFAGSGTKKIRLIAHMDTVYLRGFGAHSNDAEYVEIDSIEPRLYLLSRMIMDVAQGRDR